MQQKLKEEPGNKAVYKQSE